MNATIVSEAPPAAGTDPSAEAHAHVAHHFASAEQQFAAGKLGIWLFLITEVLFFSGLFVAYAVYRSTHPEVFVYAHQFLDKSLGALNTVVLICSSLSMAWAVRCAQLGQRRALVTCLTITLACATFFLGVKAVEYSHKWDAGLLWGARYQGATAPETGHAVATEHGPSRALEVLSWPAALGTVVSAGIVAVGGMTRRRERWVLGLCLLLICGAFFVGLFTGQLLPHVLGSSADAHGSGAVDELVVSPQLVGIFFSIYYVMTGLHAIHILAGIGVLVWLLVGALRGRFGPSSFGPVDYVGLYWHLVDLVWIYLFPLLYLIH